MLNKYFSVSLLTLGSAFALTLITSSVSVDKSYASDTSSPLLTAEIGNSTTTDFIQLAQAQETETAAEKAARKRAERRAERKRKRAERAAKRRNSSSRPRFGSFF